MYMHMLRNTKDTAFMFIIGGLLLVKIFQNRHPDFHANAFVAFFSFAVVILFTLFGIVSEIIMTSSSWCHTCMLSTLQYYDKNNPLAVRIFLLTIVLAVMSVFLFSLYYFHQWDHSKCFLCFLLMNTYSGTCMYMWAQWLPSLPSETT